MKIEVLSRAIVLMMTIFLSGCETIDLNLSRLAKFSVHIVSDPSGANIEINDNYVGKTPLTVELEGWETTRTFSRSHTIVAHPLEAGGYTQVKVFSGWYESSRTYGDTIPENIYFNMSLMPLRKELDININN